MSAGEKDNSASDLAGRPRDKRVGELLIEEGLITDKQLQCALGVQAQKGGKLFEVLIEQKLLTKESLHSFLSRQSGVPGIDLRNYEIPRELVSIIPQEFARQHVVLPIDKLGKLLTVGMACPLDTVTIHELEHLTGLTVKAMLCKLDDIQSKIQRYYPLREPERPVPPPPKPQPVSAAPPRPAPVRLAPPRHDVIEQIEKAEKLPMAPGMLQQVVRTAEDPSLNVRDTAVLAAGDPALTAKLLGVANGAAYGMAGNVTNIYLAVTLLGNPGVHATAQDMAGPAPAECPAFMFKTFLLRSVFCATAAAAGAQKSGRVHPADAYTAGLLHDTGRLALAHFMPDEYGKIDRGLSVLDLMDSELETFGFSHAEAGYRLATAWGLPAGIAGAIRTHHDAEALKLDPLAATVALMATLAEVFERNVPTRTEVFQKSPGLLAQSGLDAAAAMAIYETTSTMIASAPKRV